MGTRLNLKSSFPRSFSNHLCANACKSCDCLRIWHRMMSSFSPSANPLCVSCALVDKVFHYSPLQFFSSGWLFVSLEREGLPPVDFLIASFQFFIRPIRFAVHSTK